MSNEGFWAALNRLAAETEIVIDRPKGSRHPRYEDFIYIADYGYLKNTMSSDGSGIDVWRGTDPGMRLDAVICTVDLVKRDSEIKLLIGCTEREKNGIFSFHNSGEFMKGIMIRR